MINDNDNDIDRYGLTKINIFFDAFFSFFSLIFIRDTFFLILKIVNNLYLVSLNITNITKIIMNIIMIVMIIMIIIGLKYFFI